ncbi:hypothetical protein BDN71DRAFT_557371 [Pleurotus eryngii]|uniref:Uncharacterized protein n=1 Tax=Pleurotus eryngii TaxID=5323 RepID=A0A9P6A4K0_PLEER|nr:hypothetical protein BDN71DRAFT_557371 [Pleurotus eryngii]
MTPIYKVRLEDVLNRKHLPPLGLKDFEEWLLYVELCPENLYFVLWLREYTVRYEHWVRTCKTHRDSSDYRESWPLESSSQLAMFYARAKQTFFTANSDYELNVPSDILTPFHLQNGSLHPDPAVFGEVSAEVHKMLQESLDRFVLAAYNNVGNNRVLCGMIAGVMFTLIGGLPPLAASFALGASRWLRLVAIPGIWLGLTIFLAAFYGVCLGIYIFGDFRQLRKFELARPPISRPQTLTHNLRARPIISSPLVAPVVPRHPPSTPPTLPAPAPAPPQPDRLIIPSPSVAHVNDSNPILSRSPRARTPSIYSNSSCSSSSSSSSRTSSEFHGAEIHISPAYYDPDPIEGPATTPISLDVNYEFPPGGKSAHDIDDDMTSFATTASFIHPFDSVGLNSMDFEKHPPEDHQPISPFDFDSLPSRRPAVVMIQPERAPWGGASKFSLRAMMAGIQVWCTGNRWLLSVDNAARGADLEKGEGVMVPEGISDKESRRSSAHISDPPIPPHLPPPPHPQSSQPPRSTQDPPTPTELKDASVNAIAHTPVEARVRTQFKLVKAVPAFASPLTKVLNPIVVRGQWEIVVRSAALAFLLSWVVVGSLVAIPMRR